MKKKTIEEVKNYVLLNTDLTVLSQEYIHARDPLEFQCPRGHKFFRTYNDLHYAKRHECPVCIGKLKGVRNTQYNYLALKELAEERNHELLTKKYTRTHDKYKFRCKKHNVIFYRSANKYKSKDRDKAGWGCPECFKESNGMKFNFPHNLHWVLKHPEIWDRKMFIYIISIGSLYKIGISTDIQNRLKDFKKKRNPKIIKVWETALKTAVRVEQYLLAQYMDYSKPHPDKFSGRYECFDLDRNTLQLLIKEADLKVREFSGTLEQTTLSEAN